LTLALAWLIAAAPSAARVYRYDNTSSGAIPEVGSTAACLSGGLSRTFSVPDSFTVSTIALGLNVSHNERGDLAAALFAPDGSAQVFLNVGGDQDNNYDVLISSNSDPGAGNPPVDDNTSDPTGEPHFARLVNLSGADFYTGDASGTWTLLVCDFDPGTTGTLNRARLELESAEATPAVCTSTSTYEWGNNGNNNAFSSTSAGDVTLALSSTRDLTGDGANTAGRNNFTTQTGTFGGEAGYYIMQYDDGANGGPQNPEGVLVGSSWTFSPAVRELRWTHLDIDNGAWEDYVVLDARDAGGNRIPYQLIEGTAHQRAGAVLEADVGNIPDNDPSGNATYVFDGPVASLTIEYLRGDDFTNPNSQRIGIGNPTWCAYDYGDAPSSYGSQLSNGPRHVLGSRLLYLGANRPDGESDGQPSSASSGDDAAQVGGVDDEDGVTTFPGCSGSAGTYSVTVNVTNESGANGFLVGYVDWNRNGSFASSGNERSATVTVATGTSGADRTVTWTGVPADCGGSTATYARFRFTTSQTRAESPTDGAGLRAPDGEVEDYQITAGNLPVTLAWIESEREGDELVVRFTTATEDRNAGFRIWDLTRGHEPSVLATVPSEVVDSFVPQDYEVRIAADGVGAIGIEDLSVDGQARLHGPFAAGAAAGRRPVAATLDWPAIKAETGVASVPEMLAAAREGRGAELAARSRRGEHGGHGEDGGHGGRNPDPSTIREGLLLVHEPGIHRVSYEELLAAGIDLNGVAVARIAVTNGGTGVPAYVGPGAQLGPGAFIEFLADPELTLASPVDVFELALQPDRAVRVSELGPGAGGAPGMTRAHDRHHSDLAYSPSAPNGDPWYDARLLALGGPATATRGFDLPDLSDGPVTLTVEAWGYAHFDGAEPDHHVVVSVNGVELDSARFDGLTTWRRSYDVTSLVQESGNSLEIRLPGDTGFPFDLVNFEGFDVDYPRSTVALEGRFDGPLVSSAAVAVGGFDGLAEPVVGWFEEDGGRWGRRYARTETIPVAGEVSVPAVRGTVHLAAESRLLHPGIVPGLPAPATSSRAEYLIVTHPAFVDSLDGLVALEESRGLRTEVVTVDRIYAAYSDHQSSADAVRRFIGASLAERSHKLRYVLFVGADTTDPYDHLGHGSVAFVPTAYVQAVPDVAFAPSDEVLVDGDGDGVGDVPVGRLPVRTPSELLAVVAKLEAWEDRVAVMESRDAVLVAGASDSGRQLSEINQTYAANLAGWNVALSQVDDLGAATVRQETLAALSAGTPLVSFIGHSAISVWELTPVLHWQDVASLTNAGRPSLVVQWGCWTSYYVEPATECVSGSLLRTPEVGAAGTIGSTTLTSEASHQRLGELFFEQVGAGAQTVGDALHAAKRALHAEGTGKDALLGMILLGDPAMSLPR
jgi:subtilisin-like proprotein convertase family protein